MKNNNFFKLSSIYIGTVIGAGFASGQEIIKFFGVYGYKGIYGVILAGIMFSTIGSIVLYKVYTNKITGFDDFIKPIFGDKVGDIIDIVVTSYLFAGFIVMLSGSGAVFYENFNISYDIGIYIMVLATLITFLFSIKGISTMNNLIVPILIIGILIISSVAIFDNGLTFSNYNGIKVTKTGNWITSSLLYVSYNSLTVIVVMTSLLSIIKSKSQAIKGGLFGGLILGILAIFIIITMLIFYTDISHTEIPMLRISYKIGDKGYIIYSVILLLAMFTTAISHGYGFINRVKDYIKVDHKIIAIVFIGISIPLSKFGFSALVATIYPLYGYIGLFIIIGIGLDYIKTILIRR